MSKGVTMWLEELGLSQYADAFEEGAIEWAVLAELDHEVLKELGVTAPGHRLKILKAIKALDSESPVSISAGQPEPESLGASTTGEAERRQLTVMFCDLVGSTELSQQLDPEDLREVNRAYQDACKTAIERYEGYVARYMGDGVLAYFGYPQAHEDDAERAGRAGLALVDLVAAMDAPSEIVPQVRIGIATGPVVVGDLIGEGASQESAVVGETPNLAARLQGLAAPNAVVVSEATHALSRGAFDYEDLGLQTVKGFDTPLGAWRVRRSDDTSSLFELRSGTNLTTLVGREDEVALLKRRWTRASRGEGQVVLLSGEPGIGKSRLADTMRHTIDAEPHVDIQCQCSPHSRSTPLHPFIAEMQLSAAFTDADTATEKVKKLESLLAISGQDDRQTVQLIATLLSLPILEEAKLAAEERRLLTIEAISGRFTRLATKKSVFLLVEDIQWADPTSVEVLDSIVRNSTDAHILCLFTLRPEFRPSWVGEPHVALLALSRLTATQSRQIVEEVLQDSLQPEVIDQIVSRTDGVPLFVEELTRTLLEDDRGVYVQREELDAVPSTLQASLLARLDRLGAAKELAQVGSVVGREFSFNLLQRLAAVSGEDCRERLAKMEETGLLARRGNPPDSLYTFKHALVQDAAYQTLLNSKRREIHKRVATYLSEQANVPHELIADHFSKALDHESAIPYWIEAASHALSSSANYEAEAHARAGLAAVKALPIEVDSRRLGF